MTQETGRRPVDGACAAHVLRSTLMCGTVAARMASSVQTAVPNPTLSHQPSHDDEPSKAHFISRDDVPDSPVESGTSDVTLR